MVRCLHKLSSKGNLQASQGRSAMPTRMDGSDIIRDSCRVDRDVSSGILDRVNVKTRIDLKIEVRLLSADYVRCLIGSANEI